MLLMGLSVFASGQEFMGAITGYVMDQSSGEPLMGASIVIENSDPFRGTITNPDGFFTIDKLSPGIYNLKISFLGYEGYGISDVQVVAGKENEVKVSLTQSSRQLNEIVVSDRDFAANDPVNTMAVVSARSFNMDESER